MRRYLCPHCRKRLEEGQRIHPECISGYADAQEAKAKRTEAKRMRADKAREKKEIRERKEKLKTLYDYIREAQIAFNAYIRARDENQSCICCGKVPLSSASHVWDAGHYRSTGSASHLRFNEDNVHKQLVVCNRHGAGRAVDYRIGLIQRIGLAKVEALECNNTPHKWTREELIQITATYRKKLRELKETA